ncbi:MAG: xylulokinase [Anaerolineales bacterium]
MDYVIGCDVGSQGTKVVLLSSAGELAGEAYAGYTIDYPQPLWAEQPVERWIEAITLAVRQVMAETGITADQVRGLGLGTQVDGVVPIDANGRALRAGIIWMDRRAGAQCEAARANMNDEQVFQLTGLNLDPTHVAPKIRWLADQQPEVYERATHFLLPGSYLAYHLTGELAVDYSNASSTLLLDVRTKAWSPGMCRVFAIDPQRLVPVGAATAPLGHLRPIIAETLGLRPDTVVVIGCGDEHAACLGAGVVRSGLVGDIAGTAEPVCAASPMPVFDPTRLVETHCHGDPDLWLLENPGFVSGGNYRWFRDHFASGVSEAGKSVYQVLDAEAASVPPGSEGLTFLPCLMGAMAPTWNEHARGTYSGFTLAHTRGHFVRALLEGSAFAVRDITDQMRAVGLDLQEMRVVGGGAKGPLWNQIKADVTGLPVAVPDVTETTALGAALLALVGVGAHSTLADASERVVRIHERYEPNPAAQAVYADAYALYRETYFTLLPLYERAAKRA